MQPACVEKKSIVQRIFGAIGGTLGKVVGKCWNAVKYAANTIRFGFAIAAHYTSKVPVLGRVMANLPISAAAMTVAVAGHIGFSAVYYGFVGTAMMVSGAILPLILFTALGALKISFILTMAQYAIYGISWFCTPAAVEMEA